MSILICLTILLAWTSQCASLSLTPSTKILSRGGTSNFTLTCTIDDHPNSTTSDGGLEEVHRMRIVKRGKGRWNTVVEMSPEWKDPKVADDFQSKLTAESGQTYLQATWPMASKDTIGQYMCDLFGYLGNGEGVWQRTPSVYIDAEAPLDLSELFTMINENNKRIRKMSSTQEMFQEKLQSDIIKNKQLIEEINSTNENVQNNLNNTNTVLESVLQDVSMLKLEVSNNTNEEDIADNRELIENMSSTQKIFQRKVETLYKANGNVLKDVNKNKETIAIMNYTQEIFQNNVDNINITLESMLQDMLKFKIFNTTTRKALKNISTNKELIQKMNTSQGNIRHEVDLLIQLAQIWPQGTYALIEPETGCPVGVEWRKGYRKHHTESTQRNHDHVSSPAHMKKPVMQSENGKHFVTQHHCSVIESSHGKAWPAGSYCIMRYRKLTCPVGFEEGDIKYDEEDTDHTDLASGYYAHSFRDVYTSSSIIEYCCRNDGLPNKPIHLPTRKPFYLHRYGGICQQVKRMTVTEEFIHFDTENDRPDSAFKGFAPDDATSLPDVKLQLCYYEHI